MLLPINWLKDYIKVSLSPEKLADILMHKSFEVEGILSGDVDLPGVIVAEVLEVKKHPNADKLSLVEVTDGKGEYKVVCGAPNVEVGQKIAFATVGTKLPNGMEIVAREVRGQMSEGMICAEDELGVGEDHTGILVLPKNAKLGGKIEKYLGAGFGPVLELSITPDRNDCFSILGLAREVSALTGNIVKFPRIDLKESSTPANKEIKVEIQNEGMCPQYFATVVKNIKIDESPKWLRERLTAVGIRPINNVVDITNFVLMEFGQPLHAFDANKLKNKKLIIRNARKDEKILALDGETYNLEKDMLVIADEEKPVAIAGIMGGEETSVNKGTRDIVLESAVFDPKSIRLTSKKLGLRSESSSRFEKGFDPSLTEQAINRAAALIQELCGGEILKGNVAPLKIKVERKTINLSIDYLNKLVGTPIKPQEIKKILQSLGFETSIEKNNEFSVLVPSWRSNVDCPADLVEEVARIYGYNELPEQFLVSELFPGEQDKKITWENKIKLEMQKLGFNEVYSYSFYGEKQIKKFGNADEKHLELENPINPDQMYLRRSLLPRLFEAASRNARKFDEVNLFEIGRIFIPAKSDSLPKEELRLAGVVVSKKQGMDMFREISGVVSYIFNKMNIEKRNPNWILKLNIFNGKEKEDWKIKDNVSYFELDLEKIISEAKEKKRFKPLSLYPAVYRDLSIMVSQEVLWSDIEELVRKEGKELLKEIEFFDVYEGQGIENGKKSVAFHLSFSSQERTLNAEEVDEVMGEIVRGLEKKLKAKLRI